MIDLISLNKSMHMLSSVYLNQASNRYILNKMLNHNNSNYYVVLIRTHTDAFEMTIFEFVSNNDKCQQKLKNRFVLFLPNQRKKISIIITSL